MLAGDVIKLSNCIKKSCHPAFSWVSELLLGGLVVDQGGTIRSPGPKRLLMTQNSSG